MNRSMALVAVLLLAAGSLSACSEVPVLATPTPPSSATDVDTSDHTDALWQMVTAMFPNAERPDVEVVRYVTAAEMPQAQADCMHEAGYPGVTVTPDGGVTLGGGVPAEQWEAMHIAMYTCNVLYQLDPKFTAPLTDQRLGEAHDYFTAELIPCLEAEGYEVTNVPSRTTFIETYEKTAWSPYAAVTPGSQDEWYRINEVCPQWPDGFWG